MITHLAHLCFVVPDLDRALAFYCDTLGLRKAFDFTNDAGQRYGAYVHVGGRSFIEQFQRDLAPGSQPASYQHFCLEVDDLAATVADLRDRGVEVTEPKLGLDGRWQAWLADPDGNRIELHQYTDQSWQAPHLK